MLYTISFDLEDEDAIVYEDIYRWAHANGGYRYVILEGGGWGRLPSTCLVLPVQTDSAIDAATSFQDALFNEFQAIATHVCATPGEPAGYSRVLHVPDYAKDRIKAQVQHAIQKVVRKR